MQRIQKQLLYIAHWPLLAIKLITWSQLLFFKTCNEKKIEMTKNHKKIIFKNVQSHCSAGLAVKLQQVLQSIIQYACLKLDHVGTIVNVEIKTKDNMQVNSPWTNSPSSLTSISESQLTVT